MSLMKGEAQAHGPTHAMLTHLSHVRLFVTLWIVACQASLSTGFSRQEYWSRLPCPPSTRKSSQLKSLVSCIGKWVLYQ